MTADTAARHVFDATADAFETQVLQRSLQVPVLVDFWAEWCGPCKQLGPVLEKLAAEYNGAFELAKVDVDKEQQLAAAFQIRSIPTVMLVKDGQLVDGFPGALPEGQLREFLKQHGIEPAPADDAAATAGGEAAPLDPHAEVERLRGEIAAAPDKDELKLDLALALLQTGAVAEAAHAARRPARQPVHRRARAAGTGAAGVSPRCWTDAPPWPSWSRGSPPIPLTCVHAICWARTTWSATAPRRAWSSSSRCCARDREFDGGLPRKTLIDAFRVIDDADLVGRYRRRMSSLLF